MPNGPVYVPRASIPIPIDDGSGKHRRAQLEAALLTFTPRFDVDHETWFCDVEIVAGMAPEPFMRLGLVRYQPYAPAELRVSEPVVEWLQIPQQRTVAVSVDPNEPRRIRVNVSGTGSLYSATAPTGYDPLRIESWTQRPVMKISVLHKRAGGVEDVAELDKRSMLLGYSARAQRGWLPRTQAEWTAALELPNGHERPREHFAVRPIDPNNDSQLSWSTEFELNDNPLKPKTGGTFSVLVEEVQPMLPATYADEPIEDPRHVAKDRHELIVSGPRFAALVPLTPEEAPPPKSNGKSKAAVSLSGGREPVSSRPIAAQKLLKRLR